MKEESDFSTCRRCGANKLRKFIGYFDDKNKKYIDENERLWNGRTCPSCVAHKSKLRMRAKRKEESGESNADIKD
jgi:ribosomal protein L40E